MSNPVWETMTKIKCGNSFRVRVWREEKEFKTGPDQEIINAAKNTYFNWSLSNAQNMKLLIDKICECKRVSAVEVVDNQKNGVVYYPDWR